MLIREGEEAGDGRAEGSSAIGDGGQAAMSFMPDVDGTHLCIFQSVQLEGSYRGDLLYLKIRPSVTIRVKDSRLELWEQ